MKNNDIDLNSKIREYIEIGNEIGLFEKSRFKRYLFKNKEC